MQEIHLLLFLSNLLRVNLTPLLFAVAFLFLIVFVPQNQGIGAVGASPHMLHYAPYLSSNSFISSSLGWGIAKSGLLSIGT